MFISFFYGNLIDEQIINKGVLSIMESSSNYLKIEIKLDNNETVYHYEFFSTDEKIAYNNFITKCDRNETGFLPINDGEHNSAINLNKIVKITPLERTNI